jgi:hypothetical protein
MTKSKKFFSDIEQARLALESWRSTRKHRQRIPQSLWRTMANLAGVHGVSRISRAMNVGYHALRRRAASLEPAQSSGPGPAFLEVALPSNAPGSGCVIEMENRRGSRMTLRLGPGNSSEVLALAEAFWRVQS